jgi:SH3 domain-containing YSC84-like protein 1
MKMKNKKKGLGYVVTVASALLAIGLLLGSHTASVASDKDQAQGIVDRSQVTFKEFMRDPNYSWLQENMDKAEGVLIFPQILKGGFILGGSGGTGVLLVRDKSTGKWSDPAFYTVGSVTFGLQIGGEASQLVMLALSQKAIHSLLSSSFKLGGDVSMAVGPVGAGAKAGADVPRVTADFISFAKSKGLYGGVNLEGAVIAVRDDLNTAYYDGAVTPADIIVRREVSNPMSAGLRESLKCKC